MVQRKKQSTLPIYFYVIQLVTNSVIKNTLEKYTPKDQNRNPVDPAGGDRYWNSIKPCESRAIMGSAYCSVTRG